MFLRSSAEACAVLQRLAMQVSLVRPAAKPAAKPAADDCEMAEGRKACKNCSCGRAEAEAAGATDAAPTSACGSCYLGDGFRCAGCPYRGMPPFKPGEKVTID